MLSRVRQSLQRILRKPSRRPLRVPRRLSLERLEDRTVPTTTSWKAAVSGDWDLAGNWSSGVPTSSVDAVINFSGITVTHASNVADSANSLTSMATLNISAGSLSFAAPSTTAGLIFSAGTLTGAGDLTVNKTLNWSGGMMTGTGHTILASGGTGTLDSTNASPMEPILNGRPLDNRGNVTWIGSNSFLVENGSVWNNAVGGVLNAQTNAMMTTNLFGISIGSLTNAGTVRKTIGTGVTTLFLPVTNTGTFDVQTGSFSLKDGGSFGNSNILVGKVSLNGSSFTMQNAVVTGTGTLSLDGTTTLTIGTGSTSVQNFAETGGTLNGAGTFTITKTLTWTGGVMTGAGQTVIASGVAASINGTGSALPTLDGRSLTNHSTVKWLGTSNFCVQNGAVWNNASGSTFDAQINLSLTKNASATSDGSFVNAGTFKKSAGTGTTTVSVPFSNTGTVMVAAGTLSFSSSVTQVSGATLTAGTWTVTAVNPASSTLTITTAGNLTTIGTKAKVSLLGVNTAFTNFPNLASILAGGSFIVGNGRVFTAVGPFSNAGTVTLTGGTLNLPFPVAQLPANTLTGGTWIINASSNLNFPSGSNITALGGAKVTLSGTNSNFPALANLATIGSTSSLTIASGRTFTTVGGLNMTGTLTLTGGTLNITGAVTQLSSNTLTAGTWIVNANSNLNFAAGSNITTIGGAKVTLSGTNSNFAALANLATINSTGSFTLASGRSFTTVGALTNNGMLIVGPACILTATTGFTQASTGTLTLQIGGTALKPTFGSINVGSGGSVNLNGVLKVTSSIVAALNTSFEMMNDQGPGAMVGIFTGMPEGTTFTVKSGSTTMTFQITYQGGTGNDMLVTRIA